MRALVFVSPRHAFVRLVPIAVASLLRAPLAGAQDSTIRLSLGDAARLAAKQSAMTLSAQARADETSARIGERKADLKPLVTAYGQQTDHTFNTATFGINFPSPPGEPPVFAPNGQVEGPVYLLDLRVRESQSLFDPGARERVKSAEATAFASEAVVAVAAQQAAAQAAAAYLRAQRADAQLAARLQDSTLSAQLLSIARDQLTAGVGIALDVTRAQSQLATVHAELVAARNERAHAKLELAHVLELDLDVTPVLTDSLSMSANDSTPATAAAVQAAYQGRADVKAADAQLRATQQEVVAIQAERRPTLDLVADQGVIGKNPAHMLPTYDLGLQVNFSLFDGKRRESRVAEQSAALRDLDVQGRELERQIAVDVRAALVDLSGAREQVDAARDRLALGEQEVTQARDRFAAGVTGNADVITASLALTGARTQLVDALASYQSARIFGLRVPTVH